MDARTHIPTTEQRLQSGTLVTIRDVQSALSCGAAKAWGLVRDGHLTRIKFGPRMTRFKADEVMKLVEKGI